MKICLDLYLDRVRQNTVLARIKGTPNFEKKSDSGVFITCWRFGLPRIIIISLLLIARALPATADAPPVVSQIEPLSLSPFGEVPLAHISEYAIGGIVQSTEIAEIIFDLTNERNGIQGQHPDSRIQNRFIFFSIGVDVFLNGSVNEIFLTGANRQVLGFLSTREFEERECAIENFTTSTNQTIIWVAADVEQVNRLLLTRCIFIAVALSYSMDIAEFSSLTVDEMEIELRRQIHNSIGD